MYHDGRLVLCYYGRKTEYFRNDWQRESLAGTQKGNTMHELGILKHIGKIVEQAADKNRIEAVKQITLEVGKESGVVPLYLRKLFPVAADLCPVLKGAELRISMVCGNSLVIKEIGY